MSNRVRASLAAGLVSSRRLSKIVLKVERLLGGDEPSVNLSARSLAALKKARRNRPTAEKLEETARRVLAREHEFDNKKPVATCATTDLVESGCPFDRAHIERDRKGMLLAAAAGGKRLRPIHPRPIESAFPRLIPKCLMRRVRIRIGGEDGVRLRDIEVGPDTQAELAAEYAQRVRQETGQNLAPGNIASAVFEVLNRGGDEHLKNKSRRIRQA